MPPKSKWGRGAEIHKTNLGIPKRLWQAARIQALKEGRNLEELVAEAVSDYLRTAKSGGRDA